MAPPEPIRDVPVPEIAEGGSENTGRPGVMSTLSIEKAPMKRELSLEGSWVFAPDQGDQSEVAAYPPVFIEFHLRREKGMLAGNYTGRYRVRDRAIASRIRFRMDEESHTATSARMSWNSEDGASGKADLVLTPEDQMKVAWWTTVFGKRSTLTSGAATLTRWEPR